MAKKDKASESNVVQLHQYGRGGWQETRGAIYKAIMAGQEFESGAMNARRWGYFKAELPMEWWKVLKQDQPDYVVYSYQTPIAWHVPDDGDDGDTERWVVPDVKYSRTTTRHQNLVLTALVFNQTEPITTLGEA